MSRTSIYLLLAVLFWGFSYIAIKIVLEELTPVEMIAGRFLLASITLGLVIWYRQRSFKVSEMRGKLVITSGVIFLHFWVMATGMKETSAANTAWILTTAPIFIALLSWVYLGEKFTSVQWLGVALACTGVVALTYNGNPMNLLWTGSRGNLIVLASCVTWALYTIGARQITARLDPMVATFWMVTIAGLVFVPYTLVTSGATRFSAIRFSTAASLVFLGVFCLALAFWLWSEGLARQPAAEVGIFLYVEPLFTMIGAWIILDERLTIWLLIGALLISGGGVCRRESRANETCRARRMILTRFLLLFTVIIWGWTFVATKVALAYVEPHELFGLRLLVGLPILLIVIVKRKIRLQFNYHQNLNLILASVVIAAHFLIQITGLKYTSATNTGWLISVTPLVLAVLSFLFLREKIARNQIVGIVAATIGILFLISHGDFSHIGWLRSVGDWLVLASAFTWAIYTVVTRDISRERNPAAITFAIFLPCAVILLGYMSFTSEWSRFGHLPLDGVVAILFLGIFGTALAQWFWQMGIAKIGAAKAGYFLYLEPVATTALAVPYLGEQFTAITAVGAACVLGGVYWAQRQTRR